MMSKLKFLPRIIDNRKRTPLYLIFFVTSRCNMRCKHCFYWNNLNNLPEMSLEDIQRISSSLDNLLFMRLTGGEPFLRDDIPSIVNIFHKNNSLKNLGINTNGYLTKKITDNVRQILQENNINLDICVSIDDLQKQHDSNRGMKNAFSNAFETLTQLNILKQKHKTLSTTIGLTVFSSNQKRLDQIFNEIKKFNPDFISVNLVRGKTKDEKIKKVDISNYLSLFEKTSLYNKKKHNFYFNTQFKDKLLSKKVYKTFTESKYQGIRCVAADKVAVLYSNGDVFPCEMLDKPIGNLKEYKYNFRKLWSSEKRKQIMKNIKKNNCFCTHECFLTSSILLSPSNLLNCLIKK